VIRVKPTAMRITSGQKIRQCHFSLAFVIKNNTKPGDLVHAKGRIRNGSYEKDGERVYTVDLITEEFHLLAKHQQKGDADRDA